MALLRRRRRSLTLAAFLMHPATDLVVMALIVVSVALLVIEAVLGLPHHSPVGFAGDVITAIFAVELTLRYLAAKKKRRFFRRYWPDIIALLPLLRPLRFVRLLRLFRIFRLFQLGLILDRRVSVLRGVLRVNFYFLWALVVLTAIFVLVGGIVGYLFESAHSAHNTLDFLEESLWWALYTVIAGEPVGGMPDSGAGRALLAGMMLGGMSLFAVFTGIVSATMMERLQTMDRISEIDLEELEGHVVICGWNAGVRPLLAELAVDEELRFSPIVLVNELDREPALRDTGVRPDLLYFLRGDFTQLATLRRAGIDRAARAVVMADDVKTHDYGDRDARSVLTALTIERINKNIYCVVELMHSENEAHLAVAGVEAVITRTDLSGRALASACRHSGLMQVMMNLLTLRKGETMHRFPGPKARMPFGELQARLKVERRALLIGVERNDATTINPMDDFWVEPSDSLIVIGGPHEV
jgi:voltage-gated potassium channel